MCETDLPVIVKTVEMNPQPKITVTTDGELCYDGDAVFDITNPYGYLNRRMEYDLTIDYPFGVTGDCSGGRSDRDRRFRPYRSP